MYIRVLRKIYSKLKNIDINWVITGSLSFAIRGIPVDVHDIDIQTDKSGVYEIEKIFREFIKDKVKFTISGNIKSHLGRLSIDGIEVEIMGDIQKKNEDSSWEKPVNLDKYKEFIDVEEMNIPVLSLEYELHAYQMLGRTAKAEILKKWLKG